ncbi:hypothetical protein MJM04_32975, partial [Salmonella enterica subsp. enterica serovar Cerro]|nr:hypothetical protein [Salmonella enterica subsp. enterica serovar Cerro]
EICPTGVFTDKTHSERYNRKWDMQFAPSICQQCSIGCNISPGVLRQARANGLKTQFMGPEGVGNASLSNIAGGAAEGMLVTMPKR